MKYPIRSMFVPSPGMIFLSMDLSQAESWCVAHLAREQLMIDALNNDDIHCVTAAAIFNLPRDSVSKDKTPTERYVGKKCNHAFAYRMGERRFCADFNKESVDIGVSITERQARDYRNKWHSLYNLKSWWSELEDELSRARQLTTPYGRRRTFYEQWGKELFNEGTAYIPQSTVADHAFGKVQEGINESGGIIEISKWCKRAYCKFVHTAYDSIMVEIPVNRENEIAPILYNMFKRPLMINGEIFTIPVDVEVGDRWGELHKLKINM